MVNKSMADNIVLKTKSVRTILFYLTCLVNLELWLDSTLGKVLSVIEWYTWKHYYMVYTCQLFCICAQWRSVYGFFEMYSPLYIVPSLSPSSHYQRLHFCDQRVVLFQHCLTGTWTVIHSRWWLVFSADVQPQ